MNITALNISAGNIKLLSREGKALSRQGKALNWLAAPLSAGSLKNGLILQPETTGREIKDLFRSGKLAPGRVVCSVNGLPFTYRLFTVPALEGVELDEAVLRMARQEMAISPDEMYLTWQAYPGADGEFQVLAVGVTRRPVDNLIQTLSAAGISPWILDLPHFALARLCPYPDAVIVDFEKDCSNIVMIVGGIPRGMHMVPAGSAEVQVPDQVGQVMDKLARMIEFYNGGHPDNQLKEPLKLLVTGELLEGPKAMEYIRPQPGYSVESLEVKNTVSGIDAGRISVNAGMLDVPHQNAKNGSPRRYLDMSAAIREQRPKFDAKGLYNKMIVPLAVIAGVGLLAVSWLSMQKAQADLTKVQADAGRANTALMEKLAASKNGTALESKINAMNSRTSDIKAGLESIFVPRGYVDEVAAIVVSLPQNVTINKLDINGKEIALDGAAADTSLVVQYAGNLEGSEGFTRADISSISKPDAGNDSLYYFRIIITRK